MVKIWGGEILNLSEAKRLRDLAKLLKKSKSSAEAIKAAKIGSKIIISILGEDKPV